MEKKPIFFYVSCGTGMSNTAVYDCSGMTADELDRMAWDLAIECAEQYGTYYGEDTEASEEECDDMCHGDRNFTSEDLESTWALYDPEKHDQLRAGGGSFLEDLKDD